MSIKRFYKEASVGEVDGKNAVLLDGRPARTPNRNLLGFASRQLAEHIAGEWDGQGETLNPALMPLTRLANIALDSVEGAQEAIRADMVKFAGSDLVCYRAESPQGLVIRQEEAWDRVLFWAREKLDAAFIVTQGITFLPQSPASLEKVARHLNAFNYLQLAALHSMTTLMGSSLLALAVADKALQTEEAWAAAHIDEDWTNEFWGRDEEAEQRRKARWVEMNAAAQFLFLNLENS